MDFMSFMQLMSSSNIPILAAFFIGLMNAISPCPLAANITAIAVDATCNTVIQPPRLQ